MSAHLFYQFFSGLTVSFATEKKMFWSLPGTAAAAVSLALANSVEVGLVVAMAGFELVKGTGCFSFGSLRNAKLFSDSPRELCSVGSWVLLNCHWCIFTEVLSPFLVGQALDPDSSESKTCRI